VRSNGVDCIARIPFFVRLLLSFRHGRAKSAKRVFALDVPAIQDFPAARPLNVDGRDEARP
jgi:hypothetical protein